MIKDIIKIIINFISELIYPTTCGMCNCLSKDGICEKCEALLKRYEINQRRYNLRYNFQRMHVYVYEDSIRKIIIGYKFYNKAYLYKTFSNLLLKNKKVCGFLKNYDIIIPVPIHKKRKQERGYNQTELIARDLSKNTHLVLEKNVLVKTKNIVAQSSLDKYKRKQNINGAFKLVNEEKIYNKNILIFDDIYTTGSTVKECAITLSKAKPNKIGVLTIAKD